MNISHELRAAARSLLLQRLGLEFPEQRHDELDRRLVGAWRESKAADLGGYVALLGRLPDESPEWRALAANLTVGETYFFRDRGCLAALEEDVLPRLIEQRRRDGTRRLRLWSAGCATGEEPYTLAMIVDRLLPDHAAWSVTILGTDVDQRALSAARRGVYREWSMRDTPEPVRRRYFHASSDGTFEPIQSIREMVAFTRLNLAAEVYPSPATNTSDMDVILCRNVIMYFDRETQRAAVGRFQQALTQEGWLALSPAESSAELLRPLVPTSFPGAVLFQKTAAPPRKAEFKPRRPRPAPARPVPVRPPAPHSTVRVRPSAPELALLERARALADSGDLEQARALCLDAIANDPLDVDAHVLLGTVEQERGELAAALDALRTVIYLAPDSPSAHFTLGSLLLRQGRTGPAQRSMATVVSLLKSVPADEVVPGADGLPAGRLLELASAHIAGP